MKKIFTLLFTVMLLGACNGGNAGNPLKGKKLYTIKIEVISGNVALEETEFDFVSDKVLSKHLTLFAANGAFLTKEDEALKKANRERGLINYTYEDNILTLTMPGQDPLSVKFEPKENGGFADANGDKYYSSSILKKLSTQKSREQLNMLLRKLSNASPEEFEAVMKMLGAS